MNPIIISIEGNIGSGKTTLCKDLENIKLNLPHKIIYENVEEWCKHVNDEGKNIFELYYSNKEKYSYLFQSYVVCSRVHHILETIKKYPNHIIICERSHLTDFHIFAKVLYSLKGMTSIEFKIYQEIFKTFQLHITSTIYNKVDTDICVSRIKKRNRLGEQITPEYIQILNEAHDNWLIASSVNKLEDEVLIIDGNIEKEDTISRDKEIDKIIKFINSVIEKN